MSRNQRIKDALRLAGVSQEKLAEKLKITQAAVGKQLNKQEDIDSFQFMRAVSEVTGRSFEWLTTGEGNEKGEISREPNLRELERLREENKNLKNENEVLRSALREIGRGGSIPNRNVGQ